MRKPLTHADLKDLVDSGWGSEEIAREIEIRGVDKQEQRELSRRYEEKRKKELEEGK